MNRKRIFALLAAVVMGSSLLVGCGGGKKAKQDDQEEEPVEQEIVDTEKHMNVALYWYGTSLDPATEYNGWTASRAGVTETLTKVGKNYQIEPLLADSWERKDDMTWVFHIRDGLVFSDGTPVTGTEVKAALDRAIEIQSRAKSLAKIEEVQTDGQNVTIKTYKKFGALLSALSDPVYSIIKVGDDENYQKKPIGTGPYKIKSVEGNTTINLEKNDLYWNGMPAVDTITAYCIEDDSTREISLESGDVDAILRLAPTDLLTLQETGRYKTLSVPNGRIRTLVLNESNPDLKKRKVRRALSYAIDYQQLVKSCGDSVTRAGAPFSEYAPYGYDSLTKQTHNVEEAKRLLKEAGYRDTDKDGYVDKDGKNLDFIITYSSSDYLPMLEDIQKSAKECGIKIDLNLVDDVAEAEENRGYDILCTSYQSLYNGVPERYLNNLYTSNGSWNSFSYHNKKIDQLADQLSVTFSTKKRAKIVKKAQEILLKDTASIWLMEDKNVIATNKKITNVTAYPIDRYFIDQKIGLK